MKVYENNGVKYVVHSATIPGMFRALDSVEVCEFVDYAESLPDDTPVQAIWHPVVQNNLYRRQIPKAQIDMLLKRGDEGE